MENVQNLPAWIGGAILAAFFFICIFGSVVQFRTTKNLPARGNDPQQKTKASTA